MYEERGSVVYGRMTTFIFKPNADTFKCAFLKDAITAQHKEFQNRKSNHCRKIIKNAMWERHLKLCVHRWCKHIWKNKLPSMVKWSCYGLNLQCPTQTHAITDYSLAHGAILGSYGMCSGRSLPGRSIWLGIGIGRDVGPASCHSAFEPVLYWCKHILPQVPSNMNWAASLYIQHHNAPKLYFLIATFLPSPSSLWILPYKYPCSP